MFLVLNKEYECNPNVFLDVFIIHAVKNGIRTYTNTNISI